MYYQVSKEFFEKLPNAYFGAVAVRGLDNTREIPELEQMLAENVAACEAYLPVKSPRRQRISCLTAPPLPRWASTPISSCAPSRRC